MSVIFKPWIGSLYDKKNRFCLRVLVLGESHYGDKSEMRPTVTTDIVRRLAQDKRHRFFTKVSKVLLGLDKNTRLDNQTRAEVWEHIAFYNYIQGFVGTHSRVRPTTQMWEESIEPFHQTIDALNPQIILVLGKELGKQLPKVPKNTEVCIIQHPSTGFSYEQWNPIFLAALRRAKNSD